MPGLTGAAQVQQDQMPVRAKTAEIAEIRAGPHRAAWQADHRSGGVRTGADDVIGEVGAIPPGQGRDGPILPPAGEVGQLVVEGGGPMDCDAAVSRARSARLAVPVE